MIGWIIFGIILVGAIALIAWECMGVSFRDTRADAHVRDFARAKHDIDAAYLRFTREVDRRLGRR